MKLSRQSGDQSAPKRPKRQRQASRVSDGGGGLGEAGATPWADQARTGYDETLVARVYDRELLASSFSVARLSELELAHYLEDYVAPAVLTGDHQPSKEALFSVMAIINEKLRQRDPSAWQTLTKDSGSTLKQVLTAAFRIDAKALTFSEMSVRITFLNGAFQSLEVETVRKVILPLASLPIWQHMSPSRREQETSKTPAFKKSLSLLEKRRKKKPGEFDLAGSTLHSILGDFLEGLADSKLSQLQDSSLGKLSYFERVLELVVDLLSQQPTRRFFLVYLDDALFLVRCRVLLKAWADSQSKEALRTLARLLEMAEFYSKQPIDETTGEQRSSTQALTAHSENVRKLQFVAYKKFPVEMREFGLGHQSLFRTHSALVEVFRKLSNDKLSPLASELGIPLPHKQTWTDFERDVVLGALAYRHQYNPPISDGLRNHTLYPTETELWAADMDGTDFLPNRCLALPRINLQFINFQDYFLRSYTLYQMENCWRIRRDIETVVGRVDPFTGLSGSTEFRGWSKMAVEIKSLSIIDEGAPSLDSTVPQDVLCEISYDFAALEGEARRPWNQLREHDVLFLVDIQPSIRDQPDEFSCRGGVRHVRGLQIKAPLDISGNEIREWNPQTSVQPKSTIRRARAYLDASQYWRDVENRTTKFMYRDGGAFSILVRRESQENVFKPVLGSIRSLLKQTTAQDQNFTPAWLRDAVLGSSPSTSSPRDLEQKMDFTDTFVSDEHVIESFGEIQFKDDEERDDQRSRYCATIEPHNQGFLLTRYSSTSLLSENTIRFTKTQVDAIRRGMLPGLTLIVGPPGTGKTRVAVQIIKNIYRSSFEERTVVITRTNSALNDVLHKLRLSSVIKDEHILRLGRNPRENEVDFSLSKTGRINFLLRKRLELLEQVKLLSRSMNIQGDHGYTCETATMFYDNHVLPRWNKFLEHLSSSTEAVYPFEPEFQNEVSANESKKKFAEIEKLFNDLRELRPFELIRSNRDRGNFLLSTHARIIGMTSTYAAINSQELSEVGFKYDSVVFEEAGQMLDIETVLPLMNPETAKSNRSRKLQRCVLIGDHQQLPPVVKNPALCSYSRLNQSLFERLVRLGNEVVQLDQQGRARPEIADLYRWRYQNMGNLDVMECNASSPFSRSNPGFVYELQLVDTGDENSESQPSPHYFQNLAEAEYIAAVYQYMRITGYPSSSIVVLTMYNGQRELLDEVLSARTAWNPSLGVPRVRTVDDFQGQESDIVLLSLVRTRALGYLRDIRRLTVAFSRAKLGLYIFCRVSLLETIMELRPATIQLLQTPKALALLPAERFTGASRKASELVPDAQQTVISGPAEMAEFVVELARSASSR